MKKKILPWLAVAILYLVFCLTGKLYADYDNYDVAIIVNGLLGNNNFCSYVHPLLCVFCAGLKLLLPMADVFTLTAHLLLIAALGWMIAILWERFESWQGRVAVAAGVAYLCFGIVLWNVNYTVWAAFFSFTGCLGIYTAKDGKEGRANRIVGAAFYGFGLMFRWQAAFLALPYIALFVLANMAEERFKKERIKAELLRILPWALVFTGLTVSRLIFYSFEPWKSDLAYDRARVTMADFPILEWNELDELPEGVDPYTYFGAGRWMYADTENLSLDRLEAMADAGKTLEYSTEVSGILKCLGKMVRDLLKSSIAIPLFWILLICISGKGLRDVRFWLALAGSFVILFYFTYVGRALVRVWQSVLLALFALMLSRHKEGKEKWKKYLSLAALPFLLGFSILLQVSIEHDTSNVINAGKGADDTCFDEVYEKDQVWLVGGWITYSKDTSIVFEYVYGWNELRRFFVRQGKLPTSRFLYHFIPVSSFWYGQEYYRSLLEEIDLKNPVRGLVEDSRVRLWERSEDPFFREYFYVYLYRCYGDMDVIREKTVEGYPLFRFEKKEGGEQ